MELNELTQQLGFRVVEIEPEQSWQVQHVNEKGVTTSVVPVLTPHTWTLWNALLDAAGLRPSEA